MNIKNFVIGALAALTITSCGSLGGTTSTVPITGRKHTLLVNDGEVLALSKQQYSEVIQKSTLSSDATKTSMVKRVGQKLATAVETFLKNNGAAEDLQYYEWEFNLVKSNDVNAFCMPGGKIVVYEGLLPVTQDETSLAIVLGHEIAHAVAKHSAEQMSKQMRQQTAAQIGGAILGAVGASESTTNIASMVASTGFNFANLKFSRDNETEADRMGLIIAAMAGYDPNKAVEFWQRMASMSANSQPEFLSDHPSDATRISNLQQFIPEAQQYYKPQTTTSTKNTTTKKTTSTKKSTTKKTTKK